MDVVGSVVLEETEGGDGDEVRSASGVGGEEERHALDAIVAFGAVVDAERGPYDDCKTANDLVGYRVSASRGTGSCSCS